MVKENDGQQQAKAKFARSRARIECLRANLRPRMTTGGILSPSIDPKFLFRNLWIKLFGKSRQQLQNEAYERQIRLLQSQVHALQIGVSWTPPTTVRQDGVLLFHSSTDVVGQLDFLEPGKPTIPWLANLSLDNRAAMHAYNVQAVKDEEVSIDFPLAGALPERRKR